MKEVYRLFKSELLVLTYSPNNIMHNVIHGNFYTRHNVSQVCEFSVRLVAIVYIFAND